MIRRKQEKTEKLELDKIVIKINIANCKQMEKMTRGSEKCNTIKIYKESEKTNTNKYQMK